MLRLWSAGVSRRSGRGLRRRGGSRRGGLAWWRWGWVWVSCRRWRIERLRRCRCDIWRVGARVSTWFLFLIKCRRREACRSPGAFRNGGTYGLPSGPSTMPFESFVGAGVSVSCFSGVSIGPGAMFSDWGVFVLRCACRCGDFKAHRRSSVHAGTLGATHAGLSMHEQSSHRCRA